MIKVEFKFAIFREINAKISIVPIDVAVHYYYLHALSQCRTILHSISLDLLLYVSYVEALNAATHFRT